MVVSREDLCFCESASGGLAVQRMVLQPWGALLCVLNSVYPPHLCASCCAIWSHKLIIGEHLVYSPARRACT